MNRSWKCLLVLIACSVGVSLGAGVRAEGSVGACNASFGRAMQPVNQIKAGVGDVGEQCSELGTRLSEFASQGCFVELEAGQLAVNRAGTKGGDPEVQSPLGAAICNALVDVCGFGGLLPPGVCSE